jgi:hypothetical protein
MASRGRPVEDDNDVRSALQWLQDVAPDRATLRARIKAAHEFYREQSAPRDDCTWPETSSLVVKNDLIASYLAQADALLNDWRCYDIRLGGKVLPFIKDLGKGVNYLTDIEGAADRARRMLNPKNEHPDGALYELITAIRYAHDGFEVGFIEETSQRSGDLMLGVPGRARDIQIECKRLRPSQHELREAAHVQTLFEPLRTLIHTGRLNVHVDVKFLTSVSEISRQYLAERVEGVIGSPLALSDGNQWRDEFAEGMVRPSGIDAVHEDMAETYLLFGPKLARLLTGQYQPEGTYHIAVRAKPLPQDPRYMDVADYASILTWHCLSQDSIETRARHIGSKLAEVDRQLAKARIGITHIGMEAERDALTADMRRQRNLAAVRAFRAKSNLAEVHLHYYLPRVSEQNSWMIDESVDSSARPNEFLLDDRRLLILGDSEIDNDQPVWHLPPPALPDRN